MSAMDSVKTKIDELEFIVKLQMAKIEELSAENERLVSALGAHGTLKAIYSDSNQPAGVRVKAASAALPHETPKIMSVPPPLELKATEIIPLKDLVEARRRRQEERERAQLLPQLNGNGSDEPSAK